MRSFIGKIAFISVLFVTTLSISVNVNAHGQTVADAPVSEQREQILAPSAMNGSNNRPEWKSMDERLDYVAKEVVRNYPAESCHIERILQLFDSIDQSAINKLTNRQKTIDFQHSVNRDMGHSDFVWDISTNYDSNADGYLVVKVLANYSYQTIYSPDRSFSQITVTMLVKVNGDDLRLSVITSDDTFDYAEWDEQDLAKKNNLDYELEYNEYIGDLKQSAAEIDTDQVIEYSAGYMDPNRSLMKAYMERWAFGLTHHGEILLAWEVTVRIMLPKFCMPDLDSSTSKGRVNGIIMATIRVRLLGLLCLI